MECPNCGTALKSALADVQPRIDALVAALQALVALHPTDDSLEAIRARAALALAEGSPTS